MKTKEYFEVCAKYDKLDTCYPNNFFPPKQTTLAKEYNVGTDEHRTTDCSSGYCPCDRVAFKAPTTTKATTATTSAGSTATTGAGGATTTGASGTTTTGAGGTTATATQVPVETLSFEDLISVPDVTALLESAIFKDAIKEAYAVAFGVLVSKFKKFELSKDDTRRLIHDSEAPLRKLTAGKIKVDYTVETDNPAVADKIKNSGKSDLTLADVAELKKANYPNADGIVVQSHSVVTATITTTTAPTTTEAASTELPNPCTVAPTTVAPTTVAPNPCAPVPTPAPVVTTVTTTPAAPNPCAPVPTPAPATVTTTPAPVTVTITPVAPNPCAPVTTPAPANPCAPVIARKSEETAGLQNSLLKRATMISPTAFAFLGFIVVAVLIGLVVRVERRRMSHRSTGYSPINTNVATKELVAEESGDTQDALLIQA
jgi:hypothetical protein